MRSRTPAITSRAARARALATAMLLGVLAPFSGCRLSVEGTGVLTGAPCESDIDCLDDSACTQAYCGSEKRCVTSAVLGAVPDDANECTTDHCDGVTALHDPIADDTPCSEGLGSGVCQAGQCSIACTPLTAMTVCNDNEPCTIDTCDSVLGTCSRDKLDAIDSPGVLALPGDCQVHRCVGGVNTRIIDATDLPADLACFDEACVEGLPSTEPSALDTPCGDGTLYCDGSGACIGCTVATQCPDSFCAPAVCAPGGICGADPLMDGTPLPQQVPDDCLTFQCDGMGLEEPVANDGETPTPDAVECTGDICMGGTVVTPPLTGPSCTTGGVICNNGVCAECVLPDLCPDVADGDCVIPTCSAAGVCGTANLAMGDACGNGGEDVCNATGMCVACNEAADCPAAGECQTKGCAPGGTCAPVSVTDGTLCAGGICNGGVCKLINGAACMTGEQCISGNCPADDGVCCNLPCGGDCKSCVAGACVNALIGTDPDDDCSPPGPPLCNGLGMCGP